VLQRQTAIVRALKYDQSANSRGEQRRSGEGEDIPGESERQRAAEREIVPRSSRHHAPSLEEHRKTEAGRHRVARMPADVTSLATRREISGETLARARSSDAAPLDRSIEQFDRTLCTFLLSAAPASASEETATMMEARPCPSSARHRFDLSSPLSFSVPLPI